MKKKVILIVEDNQVDTNTYKRYLRSFFSDQQLEIFSATKAEEALTQYGSLQPDCVLIDYRLPDTDGINLLLQLQNIAPADTLCAVLITGVGNQNLAVEALKQGALDYLIKQEITEESLGKAVENAIARNKLRQQVAHQQQQLIETNLLLEQSLLNLRQKETSLLAYTEELQQINDVLTQSRIEIDFQREAAENSFLKQQAILQAATEVAIIATDLQGIITVFNTGAEKMLGYNAKEVIGLHTPYLFHITAEVDSYAVNLSTEEQKLAGMDVFIHQVKQGVVDVGEWIYQTKEGQYKKVKLMVNGIYNRHQQLEGYMSIAIDITRQKQAEQALEENRRKIQQVLDSIPHLIWTTDKEGKCTFLNKQWKNFAGIDIAKPRLISFISLVHEEDRKNILAQRTLSLKKEQPFEATFRLRGKSGEYRWMLGRSVPIYNEQGEVIERVGTATDIHEQMMALSALEENEQKFRLMTNAIPQMVWTTNSKGEVDYTNERWQQYTGLTREQTAGLGWSHLLHPDDIEPTFVSWKESLETGKELKIEQRIRTKNGTYRWLLSHALALKDSKGNIVKWFGTSIDIEDEKQRLDKLKEDKQEVQHRNRQLSQRNVDLDNFVYTVSHDLRLPVANLEGLQNLLMIKLKDRLTPEEQELIKYMSESVLKLKQMIIELSKIAKSQQEEMEEMEEIFFREVLQDVNRDIVSMLKESQARLHTSFDVSSIKYPRKYVHSILYNLLSNAIKYSSPYRIPEILVTTRLEGGGVCLSVKDNGLGLSQTQVTKLFLPFKRLHTHQAEGTGIGLFMIKRTVENYGGRITVESELGTGTTFNVFFKPN